MTEEEEMPGQPMTKKKIICGAPTAKGLPCNASKLFCKHEAHLRWQADNGEAQAVRRFNELAPLMNWKPLQLRQKALA